MPTILRNSAFFFFNDTATTEIYPLSLHDALPICHVHPPDPAAGGEASQEFPTDLRQEDRKSTRLNSSHGYISYAVFCLKKKNKTKTPTVMMVSTCRTEHTMKRVYSGFIQYVHAMH